MKGAMDFGAASGADTSILRRGTLFRWPWGCVSHHRGDMARHTIYLVPVAAADDPASCV